METSEFTNILQVTYITPSPNKRAKSLTQKREEKGREKWGTAEGSMDVDKFIVFGFECERKNLRMKFGCV